MTHRRRPRATAVQVALHRDRRRQQEQILVVVVDLNVRVTLGEGVLGPKCEPTTQTIPCLYSERRDVVVTAETLILVTLETQVRFCIHVRAPSVAPHYADRVAQDEAALPCGFRGIPPA